VELSKQWPTVFPDKNVFIKLHHIEAHVIHFILMYQMYGRLSEEGFEACHPLMSQIQSIVGKIVGTGQRINAFGRRLQMKS
jgi:hypothetical protein